MEEENEEAEETTPKHGGREKSTQEEELLKTIKSGSKQSITMKGKQAANQLQSSTPS